MRGQIVSTSEIRRRSRRRRVDWPGGCWGGRIASRARSFAAMGSARNKPCRRSNFGPRAEVLPRDGVYITRTRDLDAAASWNSITNIGLRPTFDGHSPHHRDFLARSFDGNFDRRPGAHPSGVPASCPRREKVRIAGSPEGADPAGRGTGADVFSQSRRAKGTRRELP